MPATRSSTIVLALLVSLSAIAVDISIPATAVSVENLGGRPNQAHYIILMYLLAYGTCQIPAGILTDRYGRRLLLFVGLAVFTIAGIAMTYTDNINQLLVWRFIQGAGGALPPVVARAMARDLTSGKDLQRLFTTIYTALAFITMVAPFMGSLLIELFNWRSVYWITIVLGLVSMLLAYYYVPETTTERKRHTNVTRQFLDSAKLIGKSPVSIWACGMVSLHFFGFISLLSGFTIVAKSVYGLDSLLSGALFTSGIFIYFISSMINRKLAQKYSARILLRFAAKMYLLTLLLFIGVFAYQPVSLPVFCIAFIPYLIAFGFLFSNGSSMALDPLPSTAGFASGIFGAVQIMVGSTGAFLTSLFYDGTANSLIMMMLIASLFITILFYWGDKRIAE